MKRAITALLLLLCLALPGHAEPAVEARIDISEQRMTVYVDGKATYQWPVSTARRGKYTPRGTYGVQVMKRRHYSTLYNNAPMPWSIFFCGNYAIHGTNQIKRLGTPASAGCIRLHPDNAETLYGLVKKEGRNNTLIRVVD